MNLSFDYAPERRFYALRFAAGTYESVPFIRELRFWGVDRAPCPNLSTMAALIALKNHPLNVVTLGAGMVTPSVCTALSRHFGVEIHPATYDFDCRALAGGDKTVMPVRIARMGGQTWPVERAEVLSWISLDDMGSTIGGLIRTNIDAFDLTESEKGLIVALCCAGKDVGHIVLGRAEPGFGRVLHRIGLELIDGADIA